MSNSRNRKTKTLRNARHFDEAVSPLTEKHPERLWAARGKEDVFFQREAQVTWWSVLGGIAAAALLTKLDALPSAFTIGKWYVLLYFVATCFVIINSWVQTAWGSLVLNWPISIPTSASIFFQGLLMSVGALNITKPAIWYAAMTGVILTHLFNQLVFSKSGGWITLPAKMINQARINNRIYIVIGVFGAATSVYLALRPSIGVEMVLGIAAVLISIYALIKEHVGMKEEKRSMRIA